LKVVVRLFASYRERAGRSELELELPEGSTVGYLAARVAEGYPGITAQPDSLVVAVNQEYRDHLHGLDDGDEVALIPPVSGGADD
jgi:molybdopterin converting factor subunit 1